MSGTIIHPTAIVSPEAEIGVGVNIDAYVIVERDVLIGDDCHVEAHAQILPGTRIGRASQIGRGAIIGGDPQSLTFDRRMRTFVEIGAENIIREHATIHRATVDAGSTRLGDRNFLMAASHIGHDATVGDDNVIANSVLLAGHVDLGNHTYLGGASVFHQFLRIGDHCMVQGNGRFSKDIPHFTTAIGFNQLAGINSVGMRRAGFTLAERQEVKHLYHLLFVANRNVRLGVDMARRERAWGEHSKRLVEFCLAMTKRGICSHQRAAKRGLDSTVADSVE
ncbi:MAG: acyl-ACP--UDP-N-acetylglucosamine O-acyltransferase [Verrucomicrobia bacterium]|nr:acyl-ACP--UDP-N-acetylglucosamine O-acyltransferase [Verrucomicrobiota bacterium]